MLCDVKMAASAGSGVHPALRDPWEAALEGSGWVMALLTATEGPAYRRPGAAMAISPEGDCAGGITSGCVEADLILRAEAVRAGGGPQHLRYGEGSPFFDLKLPCGGAVEIRLFAPRERAVLREAARLKAERRAFALTLSPEGDLSLGPWRATGRSGADFALGFRPQPRFLTFGTGPEAAVFAHLARSLGYDQLLLSHDEASLEAAAASGCATRLLRSARDLADLAVDEGCAATLFYHDHDHEPEILRRLLETPAFYIGAQGGRSTQAARLMRLAEMGASPEALKRLRGPIGLAPSSRDPKTLAVSVLAEILDLAQP